jgi:hypothetical protein
MSVVSDKPKTFISLDSNILNYTSPKSMKMTMQLSLGDLIKQTKLSSKKYRAKEPTSYHFHSEVRAIKEDKKNITKNQSLSKSESPEQIACFLFNLLPIKHLFYKCNIGDKSYHFQNKRGFNLNM